MLEISTQTSTRQAFAEIQPNRETHTLPIQVNPEPPTAATSELGKITSRQTFFAAYRLVLQLLRSEREAAVRRELSIGTGPDLQRS
jgi:hypothetical protein